MVDLHLLVTYTSIHIDNKVNFYIHVMYTWAFDIALIIFDFE